MENKKENARTCYKQKIIYNSIYATNNILILELTFKNRCTTLSNIKLKLSFQFSMCGLYKVVWKINE